MTSNFLFEISFVHWRLNTQFGEVKKQRLVESCQQRNEKKRKLVKTSQKLLSSVLNFIRELSYGVVTKIVIFQIIFLEKKGVKSKCDTMYNISKKNI